MPEVSPSHAQSGNNPAAKLEAETGPAGKVKLSDPRELARMRAEHIRTKHRIPMSLPNPKLAVPDIPGWYLYWFREENVEKAFQAGYIMVERGEVILHSNNVAEDSILDGNTSLGNQVSLVNGTHENGSPMTAFLMKIPQEIRDEDQTKLNDVNASVLQQVFRGEEIYTGVGTGNADHQYLKQADANVPLFSRPPRKTRLVGVR
jgi:hypothetical protein